jgi:hypothetical protein
MLLALNACWGVIDVLFFVGLARGVRLRLALLAAIALALVAFAIETRLGVVRFHAMRGASFGLFVHVPLVLSGLAWRARARRVASLVCLLPAVALVLVAADAFIYEPHALRTTALKAARDCP